MSINPPNDDVSKKNNTPENLTQHFDEGNIFFDYIVLIIYVFISRIFKVSFFSYVWSVMVKILEVKLFFLTKFFYHFDDYQTNVSSRASLPPNMKFKWRKSHQYSKNSDDKVVDHQPTPV